MSQATRRGRDAGVVRAYRVVQGRHLAGAMSGEGARRYGGRWTPPGRRAVYAAGSVSLAMLEVLVHLRRPRSLDDYMLIELTLNADAIEDVDPAALPAGWDGPMGRVTPATAVGAAWLDRGETLALRVPSVVVPSESNLVLNPAAEGYDAVGVAEARRLRFDARLGG